MSWRPFYGDIGDHNPDGDDRDEEYQETVPPIGRHNVISETCLVQPLPNTNIRPDGQLVAADAALPGVEDSEEEWQAFESANPSRTG
jgi:hypothetical protein